MYYYRRFAISKYAIPKTNNVTTHSLFAGTHPTRVFLAIVESTKSAGTQDSSPFEFYRTWEYDTAASVFEGPSNDSNDRLHQVEDVLYNFMLQQQQDENSRKGKKKQGNKSLIEKAKRLFSKDVDDGVSSTSSRCSESTSAAAYEPLPSPSVPPPSRRSVRGPTLTKSIYLTKCQLTLDGSELGKKKINMNESKV